MAASGVARLSPTAAGVQRPRTCTRTTGRMALSSTAPTASTCRARLAVRPAATRRFQRLAAVKKEAETAQETETDDEDDSGNTPASPKKPSITMQEVRQLIMMGLGTVAGDIKEINLNDPARTVVLELEANNFEDADGKPINYIVDEGYVDEKEGESQPLNLLIPVILGAIALGGVGLTLKALS